MSAVNIISVVVHNNPASFTDIISFEIEYESLYNLNDDLSWKLVYIGSAESDQHDQVLDNVLVGPVYAGRYKFTFEGNAPNHEQIPSDDIVGVTAVLLTCSYKDNEFLRIGYYVNVQYDDEELREFPPERPIIEKLRRYIIADQPRVTRFAIAFDEPTPAPDVQMNDDDSDMLNISNPVMIYGARQVPVI